MPFVGVKFPRLPLSLKKWITSILFDLFKGLCFIISIVIWDYCSKPLCHISYDSRRGEDNFYRYHWLYWTPIHHTDTLFSVKAMKVFKQNRRWSESQGERNSHFIFYLRNPFTRVNLCSFKGKSHLMEPPPIRDIVLAVATVCANNSLACQLLFLPQWEAGKRREARSERKCASLASCSRTAALEPETLGCFTLPYPLLS